MATRRRSLFDDNDTRLDPWEGGASALRDVLEDRGQERAEQQTRRLSFRDWTKLVPTARGPVDLERFAFQRELYDERALNDREQVAAKATQIGMSEQAIRVALCHADVYQRSVLYTFPTTDELADFSRKRIRPVIRASEHLMSRMRGDGVDNVGQKQIGFDGWVIFRGTNKPIDSLDIDVAIFDEYDTSDQANIEASERRVSGPMSAGIIRRLGVPSIPGFGISALYEASDQRVWTVKCEACSEWNPMRGFEAFQANVDKDAAELVCRKCRRAIDVRVGEWVAKHPDRDVRGYHIPKLLIPGKRTLALVIANSKKTKDYQRTAFFTRDLGEPWAPAEGRLSLEQVQANERPELRVVDPWGAVPATHRLRTMGVDVASVRALNIVIEESIDDDSTSGRKLWAGEIEDDPARGSAFVQLCRLMDVFGINMAVIDGNPDGRFSQAFCGRYPGRAYQVGFFTPGPQQKKKPEPMVVDDQVQYVTLWRTRAYDATFERFRVQRALIPPLDSLPSDYASHLGNLYRQKTEDSKSGAIRVDYVKTGPEDYAQAEAYNLTAIELFWRNVGLGIVAGQGPEPLAAIDPYAGPSYDEEDDAPTGDGSMVYRSAFE